MSTQTSAGARRQLEGLARAQPEAGPWLALVAAALREAEVPVWERAVAGTALRVEQGSPVPLLTGATIPVPREAVGGWLRRLLALAGNAGPEVATLAEAAESTRLDDVAVLEAAVNQDTDRLAAEAIHLGVEAEALAAVAQLATMPLLQACRRRLSDAVSPSWRGGSCPICGAWLALAEHRGLDRARRLRCGRCGGDWGMVALRCPFCGTGDHARLGSLRSESDAEARTVETCAECRGYVKTVATLRAWAGDEVCLADLATVDLDLIALERDYRRPAAPAFDLDARLAELGRDAASR